AAERRHGCRPLTTSTAAVQRSPPVAMRHVPKLVCGLVVITASPHAIGTQWSIEPQLAWLLNYNSNPQLAPIGEQGTEGTVLAADATLKRVTDTTELDLKPHVDLQRFSTNSALDATEASVQGSFTASAARSSAQITTGYERASTLTTDLSDTGVIDASS